MGLMSEERRKQLEEYYNSQEWKEEKARVKKERKEHIFSILFLGLCAIAGLFTGVMKRK